MKVRLTRTNKTIISQRDMQIIAEKMSAEHKQALGKWEYGDIKKIWVDNDGYVCICYKKGRWWHYAYNNDRLEWW